MQLNAFLQVFLCSYFFVTAVGKIIKPNAFKETMRQLRINPFWITPGLIAIVILELVVSALFISLDRPLFGILLSIFLLMLFIVMDFRGRRRIVIYRLFGGMVQEKTGRVTFLRNLSLLVMSIYLLFSPAYEISMEPFSNIITLVVSSFGILVIYAFIGTLSQYIRLYRD